MNTINIKNLIETIKYHDNLYWVQHQSEISDPAYDQLIQQLYDIDPTNEYFNIVKGPIIANNNKINHLEPMLSLDKIYSYDDLEKWIKKISRSKDEKFHISPKYDGIAAKQYNANLLTTRGNGMVGENISNKLQYINYISVSNFPILGEILLSYNNFDIIKNKYTKKDGSKYKTIRNFTAGFFNTDEIINKDIIFDFVSYDHHHYIIDTTNFIINFKSIVEQVTADFSYPIDGIVIKLNDNEYFKSLGSTTHHPRGAIAFKFDNPTAKSKLINVEWQSGTQSITPVGHIEPVEINNVIVKKVTLHNLKFILDKDIQINDELLIERSGDVIPHVINSTHGKNRIWIECEFCPNCFSPVIYEEPKLICSNKTCSGTLSRKIAESVKRIGIENLGLPTIINIMNLYNISSLYQLFYLTIDQFKQLPRFADKSATNLYNDIQQIRNKLVEDWRVLGSLMITGISNSSAKKIMSIVTIDELQKASIIDLIQIESIGDIRSSIIVYELQEKKIELEYLKQLLTIQVTKEYKKNKIKKQKICFTGKNKGFTKKQLHEKAMILKYECVKTVTKDLNLLVIPNIDNYTSSKVEKAKKYNVNILNLNQFLTMVDIK
jgi:DNA ligase (NAD+)